MDRAATSIFVFAFWILACGVALLCFPGPLLALAGIEMRPDILARLFGMVLVFNAFYYFMAARQPGMRPFYRWTTYTRALALPVTVLLVAAGSARPLVIGFVVVDALGAAWTHRALRRGPPPPSPRRSR